VFPSKEPRTANNQPLEGVKMSAKARWGVKFGINREPRIFLALGFMNGWKTLVLVVVPFSLEVGVLS